jgi:regulation of enolase protein 1 (concanavalin A-like superfamily)
MNLVRLIGTQQKKICASTRATKPFRVSKPKRGLLRWFLPRKNGCGIFEIVSSLLLFLVAACTPPATEGVDCSVQLGTVVFTKSVNRADQQLTNVTAAELTLQSTEKTDYFNEPDGKTKYGNAPLLLAALDNRKPFTFSARLTPTFAKTYDAGALYLYADRDHWLKFAFEMDERMLTRIVTVRTRETSDDNNHDVVAAAAVWLRISSNGESVGFYYSVDNSAWQLVRVYKNDFPADVWLGLSSQSPLGAGNATVFSDASLVPKAVSDFRLGI